jgi:hypothetical protein
MIYAMLWRAILLNPFSQARDCASERTLLSDFGARVFWLPAFAWASRRIRYDNKKSV